MKQRESTPRGSGLSPTDPTLIATPLDFIHEDHLRERAICAMLDRIASADCPDTREVAHVRDFLREELALHLKDEEEDLFPVLRRRCRPEEDIDKAIQRVSAGRHHAQRDLPRVMAILDRLNVAVGCRTDDDQVVLARYANCARRHLILENAIILPFARLRLTREDIETLCLRMTERRGLDRRQKISTGA